MGNTKTWRWPDKRRTSLYRQRHPDTVKTNHAYISFWHGSSYFLFLMENRMYPTSFQSLSWVKTVQQQSIIRVWFGFIMKRHYILSDNILQRPPRKAWTRRRKNLPFCVVKGEKTGGKTCPFGKQKDRLGKATVRELIRQAFRERGKNGSSKHPMGFHGSATSRRTKQFNSNYGILPNRSSDRLGRHEIPFMTLSARFRLLAGILSAPVCLFTASHAWRKAITKPVAVSVPVRVLPTDLG